MKVIVTSEQTTALDVDFERLVSSPEEFEHWNEYLEGQGPTDDDRTDYVRDMIYDLGL